MLSFRLWGHPCLIVICLRISCSQSPRDFHYSTSRIIVPLMTITINWFATLFFAHRQTDNSYYSIPDSESGCVPETLDGVRKHEQKTCDAVERKLNTTTVKDMTQGRIFNVKKKEQKTSVFNPITRNSLNSKWDLITLQYNTDISLLIKFIATKNELYFHSSAIIAGIISMAVNLVAHFGWSRLMQSRVKKDR